MPFYVYEYNVLYISIRYAFGGNVVNGFIYVIGIYMNIVILKGRPINGFGFNPQQIEMGVIIAP